MRNLLCLTLFVSLAAPSLAFAGHKEGHSVPKSLERKYERRKPEIEAMDLNGDSILQQEEIKAGIQSKFEAMDLDGNGVLSEEEREQNILLFKESKAETYGSLIDKRARKLENRMRNADANEDDIISLDEYSAYFGDRFQRMDRDEDGTINIKEFRTDTERVRTGRKN